MSQNTADSSSNIPPPVVPPPVPPPLPQSGAVPARSAPPRAGQPQPAPPIAPPSVAPPVAGTRTPAKSAGPAINLSAPSRSIEGRQIPSQSGQEPQHDEPLFDFRSFKMWILQRLAVQHTPSWLVSLVVHLAIILLLAIVPLSEEIGRAITILSGTAEESGTDELSSFEVSAPDADSLMESESELAEPVVLDAITETVVPPLVPNLSADNIKIENAIRSGLKGRSGVLKDALLKAYGGTKGTQDAVDAGLAWLASQQKSDGSWSLVGPYKGGAVSENKPAATAMALLAFLGDGNTHQTGPYKLQVSKGIRYILKLQDEEGFFAKNAIFNQKTYAQAQCTIAICELYGMTGDPELEPVAMKAIQYAQRAQAENGGWRYAPKEPGDMSVTGWYVMALMSARMGGLIVQSESLEGVHKFLDLVQRSGRGFQISPDGERYAYTANAVGTHAMTAEGMLCRLYLGWPATDPRIEAGCEMLCENLVTANPGRRSFYYWYYGTTTLHHVGGKYWKKWNDEMKEVLPALQEKSGPERGSWSAEGDPHDGGGGRLYATCLSLYCLETYYRHLPLTKMSAASE